MKHNAKNLSRFLSVAASVAIVVAIHLSWVTDSNADSYKTSGGGFLESPNCLVEYERSDNCEESRRFFEWVAYCNDEGELVSYEAIDRNDVNCPDGVCCPRRRIKYTDCSVACPKGACVEERMDCFGEMVLSSKCQCNVGEY